MHNNLKDIRQDIFDIETVPKVFYVYRGDTFELDLDLNITSSELNAVVLNCDGLPEATPLTLLESTDISSKWHLVLNKSQTLILTPKNHNFTITIVRTDGTELTLYKGIMTVNNRVYSNYSNNYYIAVLLKQTAPTIADNDYLIGTTWVNVLTNRVYFLTSVVNDEANWLDYSDQLDTLRNDVTQLDERVNTVENDLTLINERVDTHIEDLDNPHRVTAEQINTYVKTIIDNKDANTLQEAKDYTYSKVEIDDKDTAIMNKANNLENANMFKDVNYNNVNGVLTFIKYDDTTKEIDLSLELLVESGYYDDVANELVLVLANSSEIRIPVGNLFTDLDAHNIRFNGSGTNFLAGEADVEGAIKELDARVKTNADNVALKVNISDIVDNLTSTDADKPLSANQGRVLKDNVDLLDSKVDDLELEATRLDNEIARVEQKADEHIVDMNNPHGVTAEQVGTYDKVAIDLKDANVLQEAKAFTYEKTEIDNKDASTLQVAKGYADNRISEISENLEIDGGYL